MTSLCRSCQAEVIFVPSAKTGKSMILDAKPEKRVVLIHVQGDLAKWDKLCKWPPGSCANVGQVASVVDVYTDHHVTCPASKDWQGRTRANPPQAVTT